jgi:GT2 family glycosyltransferase
MSPGTSISIVVPSYNQGRFLDDALGSLLDQNFPKLELVVIDGGSSDESVGILKRRTAQLSHWVSEKDAGQYDAINKGFARTTGEVMGWLNSDDKHTPWSLSVISEVFARFPQIEWLTSLYPIEWDERGRAVHLEFRGSGGQRSFLRGAHLPGRKWFARGFLQQESTFWRRSLWEKAGATVAASLSLAGDFELWARFYEHAPLHGLATSLAGFRRHPAQ